MFERLRQKMDYRNKYYESLRLIKDLREKLEREIDTPPTALELINKVLDKGIKYYSFEDIKDQDTKQEYYNNIQRFLNSEEILNEKNGFVADIIQHIARHAKNEREMMDLRMTINGVEAFFERLSTISNPQPIIESKEDLNANI